MLTISEKYYIKGCAIYSLRKKLTARGTAELYITISLLIKGSYQLNGCWFKTAGNANVKLVIAAGHIDAEQERSDEQNFLH